MEHKFNYKWNFKDTTFTKDKGKVFSCFSCCGGSTMGYKLAGFDVIGCNEIDPRMLKVYVENHHPKYTFLEGIQTFKDRDDIPEELYNLDILDGSPPCLTGDTIISTNNGDVTISDIVNSYIDNDVYVYSINNNTNDCDCVELKKVTWGSLTKKNAEIYKITLEDGHVLKCTSNHKIATWNIQCDNVTTSYMDAIDLKCGDICLINNNPEITKKVCGSKVVSIDFIGHDDVYDITVEDNHNFFANNIVVHNCSTFSLAGSREDAWGKMKKFREGQAEQVLDTLFFDFIDLAKKLQPKIVIAENVKGMLIGNAKKYVDRIVEEFDKAGYYCVYNLLSGLDMGVPQKRERVFFTCVRKDLIEYIPYEENLFCEKVPIIKLRFDDKPVPYKDIKDGLGPDINPAARKLWEKRKPGQKSLGDVLKEEEGRDSYFNYTFAFDDEPVNTITAHRESNIVFETGKFLSNNEVILASTFPLDYNFMNDNNSNITYVCGMSVPPVMMANVASKVYEQWLKPIKEKSGE